MRKWMHGIVIVITALSLTACSSSVKTYTSTDAARYNQTVSKASNASMVSMMKYNDDTIWTFQEKNDRGLKWQIIDEHYKSSISDKLTNQLLSNYNAIVLSYYLRSYTELEGIDTNFTILDTFPRDMIFSASFATREDITTIYEKIHAFLEYVEKENQAYVDKSAVFTYGLSLAYGDLNYFWLRNDLELAEIEETFLVDCIVYGLTDRLAEFDEEPIAQVQQELSMLYANEEDAFVPTGVYTYPDTYMIASTMLYDVLSSLEKEDLTLEGSRESYIINLADEIYGPYEMTMVPLYTVEKIIGTQFTLDAQNEENTTDTELSEE